MRLAGAPVLVYKRKNARRAPPLAPTAPMTTKAIVGVIAMVTATAVASHHGFEPKS